jgi:hypothetical protein
LHARSIRQQSSSDEPGDYGLEEELFPDSEEYGNLRKNWIREGKSAFKGTPEE